MYLQLSDDVAKVSAEKGKGMELEKGPCRGLYCVCAAILFRPAYISVHGFNAGWPPQLIAPFRLFLRFYIGINTELLQKCVREHLGRLGRN